MNWRDYNRGNIPDLKAYFESIKQKDIPALFDHGKDVGHKQLRLIVKETDDESQKYVSIDAEYTCLLKFKIGKYPECCAMMQFYAFFMNTALKQEVVDDWMQKLLVPLLNTCYWFNSRRLMVAMVEENEEIDDIVNSWHDVDDVVPGPTTEEIKAKKAELLLGKFNPKGVNRYEKFYHYFNKQKRCRTVDVMFNSNTNNLIHLIEVIFE